MDRQSYIGYRVLSAALTGALFILGGALLYGFAANTVIPSSMVHGNPPILTDYWGYYMMGFAGTLLITWGVCLVPVIFGLSPNRGVGTATAVGLVLNAIFRMVAWFSGEYAEVGNVPRVEAAIMLMLAIGFIWLRPPRSIGEVRQSAAG